MESHCLQRLLEDVERRELDVQAALAPAEGFPYKDLRSARLNSHSTQKEAFLEVVLRPGKLVQWIVRIPAQGAALAGIDESRPGAGLASGARLGSIRS